MELSEKYILELNNFHKAVNSFEAAMDATFENLNSIGEDLIKNGKIQKFEYCAELAWKISKIHVASHIYKESMYQEVFDRLPLHLLAFQWLIAKL